MNAFPPMYVWRFRSGELGDPGNYYETEETTGAWSFIARITVVEGFSDRDLSISLTILRNCASAARVHYFATWDRALPCIADDTWARLEALWRVVTGDNQPGHAPGVRSGMR